MLGPICIFKILMPNTQRLQKSKKTFYKCVLDFNFYPSKGLGSSFSTVKFVVPYSAVEQTRQAKLCEKDPLQSSKLDKQKIGR